MLCYLVRHGIAEELGQGLAENDEERPLTLEGIEKMQSASKGFFQLDPRCQKILTSPLVRAQQTAQIIAHTLGVEVEIEQRLAPGGNHAELLNHMLTVNPGGIALVGHQPDLTFLASRLLTGKPQACLLEFRKGTIGCIEWSGQSHGLLLWHATPKMLRRVAKGK